jgi:aldose 1-epimerase
VSAAPGTLVLRAGDAELEVARVGATPLRWTMPLAGTRWDLLDGYRDEAELAGQDGVRNGVMAPFCNRVADARYTFEGVEHDLAPGAQDRVVYHGLVRTEPFTVVSSTQDTDRAEAVLRCTALADGSATGYPFAVVVDVRYVLGPRTLDVAITGHNVGQRAAPYASGWHPYLRLPGADRVDRLELEVPAGTAVRTDAALVPLPAGAAYEPVTAGQAAWRPLGDAVLDAAFTDLDPARPTVLRDPVTGVRVELRQDRGLVHVFTGDTLARDRRASVAVEPVEVMTDAFHRPECATSVRLEPGAHRTFAFGLSVTAS